MFLAVHNDGDVKSHRSPGVSKGRSQGTNRVIYTVCCVFLLVLGIIIIGIDSYLFDKYEAVVSGYLYADCVTEIIISLIMISVGIVGLIMIYANAEINKTVVAIFNVLLLGTILIRVGMLVMTVVFYEKHSEEYKCYISVTVLLGIAAGFLIGMLFQNLNSK
ncbi:hypothetical protein SNEBB_009809 [Seison nebaliae]|nr:hypothetical protein SNEBB_009809 [Seison nebaliae]